MTGGCETIVPASLTHLSDELRGQVATLLQQAHQAFDAAEVGGDAFSTAGLAMQIVYPGTRQWALRDCQRKGDELTTACDKLDSTADTWNRAEHESTVPGSELV